jgi:glycosyltransferase involved in cell wall biosynthesis
LGRGRAGDDGVAGSRPRVALFSDAVSDASGEKTGIGRYVHTLHAGLGEAGFEAGRFTPTLPLVRVASRRLLRLLGRDVRSVRTHDIYPLWSGYPDADIYHLTSQTLASLLLLHRPKGRVVVTVHDIFPYMLRDDPQLPHFRDHLNLRLAMSGLKRADHLITVSQYSKRCVVEHLGIAPERITVIYQGVDHERFRPLPVDEAIRQRYGLSESHCYLIYVGTEDPRKNLATLVRALAKLRHELPDVELIKIGRSHFDHERHRLIELATQLGVRTAIHFLEDVPEDDLPLLYNLADVYVTPSLYEGFGFPVLEAMACGTPVVCAEAGSLPEIAGSAALRVLPCTVETLAEALRSLLTSKDKQLQLRRAGQNQARRFAWPATIENTAAAYRQLIHL